ncbi:MAG TPA: outer membrane lipoprotein-sorting protein [Amycolatopsis sp.]|nr:outer membrane lipoprotein-sorting protein [Amycolatopsis sp.]
MRKANRRPIGRVELRDVVLDLGSRRLNLRTLRRSDDELSSTVCCVMAPRELCNINFLVRERRGRVEPFDIVLHLPFAGGSTRRLDSFRRREGLLGSEFSYDDLRVWLYEDAHSYTTLDDGPGWVRLRGRCVTSLADVVRTGDAPFDLRLREPDGFVTGIDYHGPDGTGPRRRYRADRLTVVDGITVPQLMEMTDVVRGRSSRLHLESVRFTVDAPPRLFTGGTRGQVWQELTELD